MLTLALIAIVAGLVTYIIWKHFKTKKTALDSVITETSSTINSKKDSKTEDVGKIADAIVERKSLYWYAVATLLTFTTFSLLWIIFGGYLWYDIRSVAFLFLGLLILVMLSIKEIDVSRVVGITVFGIPTITIKSGGLWLIIPGIMRDISESKRNRQRQFPSSPENVFHGLEADFEVARATAEAAAKAIDPNSKSILVRPVHIMTGAESNDTPKGDDPVGTSDTDPLTRRLQPKVTWTVTLKVTDPFAFNINAGGEDNAFQQIQDTSEELLAAEFGKKNPSDIVSGLETIRDNLKTVILKRIVNWGCDVIDISLPAPDFGKTVAGALAEQGAGVAKADMIRTQATADAFAIRQAGKAKAEIITLTGEAEGNANRAREAGTIGGRADGIAELKDKLGVAGEVVLAADTTIRLQDKADLVVATEGFAGMIGATMKALNAFKKI